MNLDLAVSDSTISLLVLLGTVVLFVTNRLPVGVVAVITSLALYVTGVLDAETALSGFGDPVVIFIASLFIVSEGIDSTGVTTWAGQSLIDRTGESVNRLLVVVMTLCAVLTALITLNGSVAALLPMVVVLAVRLGVSPAQMLMPMAFAGSAGSVLVLTGSPVNVLVSDASVDAGSSGFGFFEFAAVGIPLVLGTVVICLLLSRRVLPYRVSKRLPPDLSGHAATLAQHYSLDDGFYRLRVRSSSSLIGVRRTDVALEAYPDVVLIGLQPARRREELGPDDVLVVSGPAEQVSRLVVEASLTVLMEPLSDGPDQPLLGRELGVVEVVVPPRSPLIGESVFPGQLRGSDLMVLAVQRRGKDRGAQQTSIEPGDTLLLQGTWPALDSLADDRDVLVVDSPDLVRRQTTPPGPKALVATGILLVMVTLLIFNVVPTAIAGLIAATAMVALRVVTVEQAYRSVSWSTIVLIGGLIPLSTAIKDSGAADKIARLIVDVVGTGRPNLLLVALFLLTAVLGQIINNTATTLIVLPIAVSAAAETAVSVQPVLMLVAVAGAASLLTPIATPANMMVMGPGDYEFGDYWKLGLPVMAWWLVASVAIIPLVWGF